MIGIFRNSNPFSIILLFFYGLVLRYATFVEPYSPTVQPGKNDFSRLLIPVLQDMGASFPLIFPLLAYLLTFVQALLFNSFINKERLMQKTSFIPAMTYLLLMALFPEWTRLSLPLMASTLVLLVWGRLGDILFSTDKVGLLFNAGLLLGLASFLYFPSLLFLLIIFAALLIMGPSRATEWASVIPGVILPYYFAFSYLYLSGQWAPGQWIPQLLSQLPRFQPDLRTWTALVMILIPFFIGVVLNAAQVQRMLIRARKGWSLVWIWLILALFTPFINTGGGFENWVLAAGPLAAFHTVAYLQPQKKFLLLFIHWAIFLFILYQNAWVLRG